MFIYLKPFTSNHQRVLVCLPPTLSAALLGPQTYCVFASNLKLAPWNHELGSIERVIDEQKYFPGEDEHRSCIPQGKRTSNL